MNNILRAPPDPRRRWLRLRASRSAPSACCRRVRRTAEIAPLFRLFLLDGTVVTCLGEYARVGERVVFTLPLSAEGATELASLPAARVDWTRTDQYADSLRAARYADSRGESDFADLAGDVARILNEIALDGRRDPQAAAGGRGASAPRLVAPRALWLSDRRHRANRGARGSGDLGISRRQRRKSLRPDVRGLAGAAEANRAARRALDRAAARGGGGRCRSRRRSRRAADAVRVAGARHRQERDDAERPRLHAPEVAGHLAHPDRAAGRGGVQPARGHGEPIGRASRAARRCPRRGARDRACAARGPAARWEASRSRLRDPGDAAGASRRGSPAAPGPRSMERQGHGLSELSARHRRAPCGSPADVARARRHQAAGRPRRRRSCPHSRSARPCCEGAGAASCRRPIWPRRTR